MGKVYVFAGFVVVILGAIFVGIIAHGMYKRIKTVNDRKKLGR